MSKYKEKKAAKKEMLDAMSEEERKQYQKKADIRYWVTFVIVVASVFCLLKFVIQFHPIIIHGSSMEPTYSDGQIVPAFNCFYEPKQGDVVVFDSDSMGENLIKRVIATAGQTVYVDYANNKVYVDNKAIDEPYLDGMKMFDQPATYTTEMPYKVPENCIFVMGDNRNDSLDSRSDRVGVVNLDDIVGHVVYGQNKDGSK